MSDTQYQAQVGPFTTAQPSETYGWPCYRPDPPRRAGIITALSVAASVIAPIYVADVTKPAPTLSWQSDTAYPSRIHRVTLPRAGFPAFTQNVQPIPGGAFASGGQVIATGTYDLWQYQALVGPLSTTAGVVGVAEYAWKPSYPDAHRPPLARSHQAYTADRFDAPASTTAPDFSWQAIIPARIEPRPPIHPRMVPNVVDPQWRAPQEPAIFASWRPVYPERPVRKLSIAYTVWAQPHFGVEVDVPVMAWTGWYLDPPVTRRDRPAQTGASTTTPPFVADVTVSSPVSSWQGVYPATVRRTPPTTTTTPEVGPLAIADVTDTSPTLGARAIYPDAVAPVKGLGAAQRAFVLDARWTTPTLAAAPALAQPVYPDRVYGRPVPTSHPDWRAPEYILDVTVPAPTLSWAPTYPDRVTVTYRHSEWMDSAQQAAIITAPNSLNILRFRRTFFGKAGTRRRGQS